MTLNRTNLIFILIQNTIEMPKIDPNHESMWIQLQTLSRDCGDMAYIQHIYLYPPDPLEHVYSPIELSLFTNKSKSYRISLGTVR